jgi:hypothetical protein
MLDGTGQPHDGSDIQNFLLSGKVFIVNSRRRNGLVIFKHYHAEFAGPGAIVGGDYDRDCQEVIPIGNLSLLIPESEEEVQKAYLIRRQWVRLIEKITKYPLSKQRAQKVIAQFEEYFEEERVSQLPDRAFAMLVGIIPQTVAIVRRLDGDIEDYEL